MAAPIASGTVAEVIQHQQQQQQQQQQQRDESNKIFVGGVGKNTTEASLRMYFSKFGMIEDSVIMMNRETGEHRGFAFVTFKSAESVQLVIDQCNSGGHTLDGKAIDPKPAVPQGPNQQHSLAKMKHNLIQQVQGVHPTPTFKGPMQVPEDLKVFVGGIGIGTTDADVRAYFETFGDVVAVDMPFHKVYNCPKGFAFVGFKDSETVTNVTKERYHQINGKTVEVKGADEQRAHIQRKRSEGYANANRYIARPIGFPQTAVGTIPGVGMYPQLAAAQQQQQQQQVLIPQVINGQTQYITAQIPATPAPVATPQYVFDASTNTYYQLPATSPAATAYNPYGGVQVIANPALAAPSSIATSPVLAQPAVTPTPVPTNGAVTVKEEQLGNYSNETSTFGPSRHVGGHGQGGADSQVVYSHASAPLSGGETVSSRGFHPYGR